jgi:hypothetical protein
VWGINAGLCQREYLWNAVERTDKRTILLKFEMSWPPTIRHGIQIEGCGPGISNVAQIAGYHYFSNVPVGSKQSSSDSPLVDPSSLPFDDRYDRVTAQPAVCWRSLPAAGPPPLEVELVVQPLARGKPEYASGPARRGAARQVPERAGVALQRGQRPSSAHLPQPHSPIPSAAGQQVTVG